MLLLPLYIVTLSVSAGLAGAFVRQLAASQGFLPTFETGVYLAAAVACAYAIVQLLYVFFLAAAKPTRSLSPLFPESLSHLSALVLMPYLLAFEAPWPHPALARVELFIYLAAFAGLHLFFKLLSLFTALQAPPGPRLRSLGWLVSASAMLVLCLFSVLQWRLAMQESRVQQLEAHEMLRVGDTFMPAQQLAEGGILNFELPREAGKDMVLFWGNPPGQAAQFESIYVSSQFTGEAPQNYHEQKQIVLPADRWVSLRIPAADIPEGASGFSLFWSGEEEPVWVRETGLRPVKRSYEEILISGPQYYSSDAADPRPNVLMVLLEGLGSEHVHHMGYEREVTPALDQLAQQSLTLDNVYTPIPAALGAAMSILTGLNPLAHGYMSSIEDSLPRQATTLTQMLRNEGYLTAAFTEGEGLAGQDMVHGAGIDQGFDFFDPSFPVRAPSAATRPGAGATPEPLGSAVTLRKAGDLLDELAGLQYFMLIRLRELESPSILRRYERGMEGWQRSSIPMNMHDTELQIVNQALQDFFARLGEAGHLENTCVVVTSLYGLDFSEPGRGSWRRGGPGVPRMTESTLRTPLYIAAPGKAPAQSSLLTSLEDVGPTLASLLGLQFPHETSGRNLYAIEESGRPVSMRGRPLVMSLRVPGWRFTWQSGRAPFTLRQVREPEVLDFISIERYHEVLLQPDYVQQQPQLARQFTDYLRNYLERWSPGALRDE